jgi:hypothetical protein
MPFVATTDAQWDRIAELVRRAGAGGDRMPLDDVFPQTRRLYSQPLIEDVYHRDRRASGGAIPDLYRPFMAKIPRAEGRFLGC